MNPKRFRLRYVFWLDMHKPDEERIADQIDHLKSERSFARTIRDGIRLICDLRAGRLDVLFELFPWVSTALAEQGAPSENASAKALREQLERIEYQLLQQGNTPINLPDKGRGERVSLDDKPLPSIFAEPQDTAETAAETRATFVGDMGDLFADDDADLWD